VGEERKKEKKLGEKKKGSKRESGEKHRPKIGFFFFFFFLSFFFFSFFCPRLEMRNPGRWFSFSFLPLFLTGILPAARGQDAVRELLERVPDGSGAVAAACAGVARGAEVLRTQCAAAASTLGGHPGLAELPVDALIAGDNAAAPAVRDAAVAHVSCAVACATLAEFPSLVMAGSGGSSGTSGTSGSRGSRGSNGSSGTSGSNGSNDAAAELASALCDPEGAGQDAVRAMSPRAMDRAACVAVARSLAEALRIAAAVDTDSIAWVWVHLMSAEDARAHHGAAVPPDDDSDADIHHADAETGTEAEEGDYEFIVSTSIKEHPRAGNPDAGAVPIREGRLPCLAVPVTPGAGSSPADLAAVWAAVNWWGVSEIVTAEIARIQGRVQAL
jgi:uncharacterized membrane protein YgcG